MSPKFKMTVAVLVVPPLARLRWKGCTLKPSRRSIP